MHPAECLLQAPLAWHRSVTQQDGPNRKSQQQKQNLCTQSKTRLGSVLAENVMEKLSTNYKVRAKYLTLWQLEAKGSWNAMRCIWDVPFATSCSRFTSPPPEKRKWKPPITTFVLLKLLWLWLNVSVWVQLDLQITWSQEELQIFIQGQVLALCLVSEGTLCCLWVITLLKDTKIYFKITLKMWPTEI